jgi:oxygen-independent coproporphyrinogen-3 oxidase
LEKYDVPVPRYTSYPPANHFADGFSETTYLKMIEESNQGDPAHIAFYIHIPFCHKICFYCGCNALTMKSSDVVEDYFKALESEIALVLQHIDKNRKVSQIHYGGGTPNSVDVKYIARINALLLKQFEVIENPEIAIECHPAHLDKAYVDELIKAGFNRISLGIQDFNVGVLKGVNRLPSAMPVNELVDYIRSFSPAVSVNLDFIYGLPGQAVESFSQTIQQAIKIRPDRLVTFSYAHVPWLKKHQNILERKGLPSAEEKMEIFLASRSILEESGYTSLGLDHYVLPDDELSIALKNKQVNRNFQGYCTRRTTGQVYAFGVSAISQLSNGYVQNVKGITPYIKTILSGNLPVEKGLVLSQDQKVIKETISELMCNLNLNLNGMASVFGKTVNEFEQLTGFSMEKLEPFKTDGLILVDGDEVTVTRKGALFIRNIAAAFDPGYQTQNHRYSKSV